MRVFVGVDVAKRSFVAAILNEDKELMQKKRSFSTHRTGFDAFAELLHSFAGPEDEIHFGIEACGNLHVNLIFFLHGMFPKIVIYVLNPLTVSRYGTSKLHRNHTDHADAYHIGLLVANEWHSLHPWQPNPAADRLRRLVLQREHLVSDHTAETNRLHASLHLTFPEFTLVLSDPTTPLAFHLLKQNPTAADFARRRPSALAKQRPKGKGRHALGSQRAKKLVSWAKQSVATAYAQSDIVLLQMTIARLELLKQQILQIENQIEFFLEEQSDCPLQTQLCTQTRLLTTVPGIGLVTAAAISCRAPNISQFKSVSAFCAFIGTCPQRSQTGTSRDSAALTPYAHRSIRADLFLCAQTAIRCFPPLRFYFRRHISNGHKYKQAVAACMNRLARWIYGVALHHSPFNPQHTHLICARQLPDDWEAFSNEIRPPKERVA